MAKFKDHRAAYGTFFNRVKGEITPGVNKLMVRAGANEAIHQIRQRNDNSIDVKGQKFRKLDPRYLKQKKKRMRKYHGRFAAESPGQHMRLSGNLYRSMSAKAIRSSKLGNTIEGSFTLYIKGSKNQKKLTGLRDKGFDPFPLAKKGTAQRAREDRAITRRMKQVARIRLGKGVVVNL